MIIRRFDSHNTCGRLSMPCYFVTSEGMKYIQHYFQESNLTIFFINGFILINQDRFQVDIYFRRHLVVRSGISARN